MDTESDKVNPPKRVVVCGGGIIGVCTAYYLSKNGAAVTLIERSSIACAASGKAGGFLALDMCDNEPISELARTSFNLHRSLSEELNGPQSYGYRPLNAISISITESEAPGNRNSSDEIPAWVDGPAKSPKTMGTIEAMAQVHPQLFTQTLMSKAVAEYGVKVVIGTMKNVTAEEGRVTAVVLEGGEVIETDVVVLALGPWSGKLPLLASLFRVYGLKCNSIVLEPKEVDVITPHALFLTYYSAQGEGKSIDPEVYPRPTGEVYICGQTAAAEVPDDPEEIKPDLEAIKVIKTVAKTVSSYLGEGEARVKAEQACFLPCTDDNVPIIGELPGLNGCYVATGHSCWGILNGPATGAALTELVLRGLATTVDLSPFSPERFVSKRSDN